MGKTRGVIATPHHTATEVGAQVLRDGGNAIDAAIAADAVLCVVYPHMTSVAGDLMAIVWPAGGASPVGLIGAGRSGELATVEAVRERGHEDMPARGVLSVTVPGTVEAWGRLLERFGSVGFGAVLDPAAGLAQDGYIITRDLADNLASAAELLLKEPASFALRLEAGQEFRAARDAAYALRDRYITDPEFAHAPPEAFLDPRFEPAARADATPRPGDTIYLCAADEHGNVVSLIQSVAYDFGSGVVAEGTGMLLQNRGAYFKLDPSHVNRLEPKKRTMHTLIPAMAARDGRPWAALGTMGGERQPQLQVQVLRNLVDEGLDPAEAVARPRKAVLVDGETLAVEADYPGAAAMARGDSRVKLMPARHSSFGHAHAIVIDGPGAWRAGADPRSDGSVEHVRE